jgi:formamidase
MAADHRLAVDLGRSLQVDARNSHNRWHPDIPPALRVAPGETVEFEVRDAFDLAIGPGAGSEALGGLELGREHPLTGPIFVEGAEPGDALEVELLSFVPARRAFSLVFPGFNALPERFADPIVTHWEIEDGVARAADIPGVALRGEPFIGTAGVAPSMATLARVAEREARLAAEGVSLMLPTADFAVPAEPAGLAAEALRTMPAREVGGNMDVPQFGVGSVVRYPVEVPGALFSVGDPHFLQGDGELSGSAIEMSATVTMRFGLVKAADLAWAPPAPSAVRREQARAAQDWLVTTGISVDADGVDRDKDVGLAAHNAVAAMVDRVVAEHGLEPWQAFTVVSLTAQLRISLMVVSPNAVVTAEVPADVFARRDG